MIFEITLFTINFSTRIRPTTLSSQGSDSAVIYQKKVENMKRGAKVGNEISADTYPCHRSAALLHLTSALLAWEKEQRNTANRKKKKTETLQETEYWIPYRPKDFHS